MGWGWYHLSTVPDDYSRYILPWTLPTTMQATDVMATLKVPPIVPKAQARDYRKHIDGYALPRLGAIPVANPTPREILGPRAKLLQRGLALRYVKNIIAGSFRAMIQQALDDRKLADDPFPRHLKWPKWRVPPGDPSTTGNAPHCKQNC